MSKIDLVRGGEKAGSRAALNECHTWPRSRFLLYKIEALPYEAAPFAVTNLGLATEPVAPAAASGR
jgi:hypothetical protein